jgi:hypothetical protein
MPRRDSSISDSTAAGARSIGRHHRLTPRQVCGHPCPSLTRSMRAERPCRRHRIFRLALIENLSLTFWRSFPESPRTCRPGHYARAGLTSSSRFPLGRFPAGRVNMDLFSRRACSAAFFISAFSLAQILQGGLAPDLDISSIFQNMNSSAVPFGAIPQLEVIAHADQGHFASQARVLE